MKDSDEDALLERIAELLAAPEYADHPLHEPLERLYLRFREQQHQLERLVAISDRYHSLALEAQQVAQQRYERALRRQRKLSRISDGYQAMMRESNQALQEASHHDPLTELPNRRLIGERLERFHRQKRQFSLAVLDLDHFKRINDRYGHDVGDRLLVAITTVLRDGLRAYDLCARWGGEEFLLLLADTHLDAACEIVERLRTRIAEVSIGVGEERLSITVSAGLSEYRAGEPYQTTLRRADQALLRAKRDGRNRCLTAPS